MTTGERASEKCDTTEGPCACGAWHKFDQPHDPLCVQRFGNTPRSPCICAVLNEARADEREKALREVEHMLDESPEAAWVYNNGIRAALDVLRAVLR